jgi:hypothetical protein
MLTEKDFYDYFAEETISIGFVSTHKPEEPLSCLPGMNCVKYLLIKIIGTRSVFKPLA